MTSAVRTRFLTARSCAVAAVVSLGVAGCSVTPADSARTTPTESSVTDPADTDPPPSEVPATEPPTSEPATTEPATTDAPTTPEPPSTDAPEPTGNEAFCAASTDFWLPSEALDYIDDTDGAAAEQLFADMTRLIDAPIAAAPDPAAAAPAQQMKAVLADLTVQLDEIGYDLDRLAESSDADALAMSLGDFGEIANQLELFLQDSCGLDDAELQQAAESYARGVAPGSPDEPGDLPATSEEIESARIEDASGTISVAVPADWTDINPDPGEGYLSVQASANLLGFLSSFTEPGVFVEAYPTTNGGADGAAGFQLVRERFVGVGCTDGVERDYDDGVYTGLEVSLDCAPGTDLIVIGGSNEAEDTYFIIAMLVPDDDPGIRDLIAASFIVD